MPTTTDDVDEHPIIFSEWSVRRILACEKTQTRRIVKPQPPENADHVEIEQNGTLGYFSGETAAFHDDTTCHYGQRGDVLWVREAFRFEDIYDDLSPTEYLKQVSEYHWGTRYEADGSINDTDVTDPVENGWGRKRPSIHMPRELCRIRLCVKNVRVERVQDILAEDAVAEGISKEDFEGNSVRFEDDPRLAFADKWREIHGDGAWEENPWVWCISFSRIDDE